jgi:hypothetical protein
MEMDLLVFTVEHETSYLAEFGISWDALWRIYNAQTFTIYHVSLSKFK